MSAQRAVFLFVITIVFATVLVYPPVRFWSLIFPDRPAPVAWAAALFIMPFIVRFMHGYRSNVVTRALSAIVLSWVGISFLGLSILLPLELFLQLTLTSPTKAGFAALALLSVLSLYSLYNAHPLHVKTLVINNGRGAAGSRIAQVSDLHLGSRQPGLLARTVVKLQALQPDYVALTGDIVDMYGITEQDLRPLESLEMPVLFCIGNHERYVDLVDICTRLRNCGVHVLRNQTKEIGNLQFIGIDDAESKSQVATEITKLQPSQDNYRILLYHRPDGGEAAAAWGVDLMLTGHTHRGQLIPFNLLVKRVFPRLYRDYKIGDMTLYVSPGTGTWGPVMRLGSKCEITLIELM